MLITQGYFRYCWPVLTQHRGLLISQPSLTANRLGMHKNLEGDTAGMDDSNWPNGCHIPYEVMLSIYSGGRRSGGHSEWWHSVFPSNCCSWQSPAFLEMGNHLSDDGKYWMNILFCFPCIQEFSLPIKLSLSQTTIFHAFAHLILFPSH